MRRRRAERAVPEPLPHRPLAVIRVRGSQEDMGAQHAAALVRLGGYRALVEFYSEFLERTLLHADASTRPRSPARHAVRAVGDVLMRCIERDRPAPYLLRSRAFMHGLGLPREHARYLTIMDVLQNLVGLAGRVRLGPFSRLLSTAAVPACSTLMAWGEATASGHMLHARNFDFPGVGVWDRGPTVVLCDPDRGLRYGFVTSRGADTPGVSAFNEAGIGVTMHTRFHRDVAFRGAAVIDVGHDIACRAECIDDAVALVRERPVASTWGIAVSSAREGRAVVIETTARNVSVVESSARDHLSCANRYRHADTMAGQVAPSVAWEAHSSGRQASLHAAVDQARPRGGVTVADLQRALDSHVDPRAPGVHRGAGGVVSQPCTVKSMVIEPEARRVHVSVGRAPTSRGPYVAVPWDWDGAVGGVELEHVAAADEPAGDAERAYLHYAEASRLESLAGDWRGALRELERAVWLAPGDPSYRFLAGVLRLRTPEYELALEHLVAGLETETLPLRRGQLLLWASRAADAAGQAQRARTLRAELLAMDHDELAEYRSWARAEERKPFDARKRRVRIDLLFGDAW